MRRVLLEDIYNFEDVLQVGCIINTFIRRSDRGEASPASPSW
jgi:alpha-L-arabinofuranosidase